MSINPYDSPETPGQAPAKAPGQRRFTLVELLIVVAVIGVLVAMLLPAVRTSGEAARRSMCSNNLRHIAIALRSYETDHNALPPAYTVDADGKPLHSWRTLILPYLEQKPLYDKIDLSKPWNDPANKAANETRVSTYQCPSANTPAGHTTYLAVVGPTSCLQPARPRPSAEIKDGRGSLLIVMEMDPKRAVHWMSPMDASEQAVLSFATADPLSHPGGAHGVLADGSIRFFGKDTTAATLQALISIAGKDDAAARSGD